MVDDEPQERVAPARRWPRLMRRQVMAQIIVGVVILVSGMAIGVGGTLVVLKDRFIWRFPPRRPERPDPNRIAGMITGDWTEKYDLTEEQTQKVKELFATEFQTRRARVEKMMEADRADREQFAQAMKEILTPEQFERWEHDFRERGERYRRMGPFRSPRGPGGHRPPGSSRGPRGTRRSERQRDRSDESAGPPPNTVTPH